MTTFCRGGGLYIEMNYVLDTGESTEIYYPSFNFFFIYGSPDFVLFVFFFEKYSEINNFIQYEVWS